MIYVNFRDKYALSMPPFRKNHETCVCFMYCCVFLQKVCQWFAGILVIFLTIVTLIGTTDDTVDLTSSTYVAVIFGFTLLWVVRSAAIKYFSQ